VGKIPWKTPTGALRKIYEEKIELDVGEI